MYQQTILMNVNPIRPRKTAICQRCKRPLSDPKSVEAGMGAICRGHSGKGKDMNSDTAKRTEYADKFDDSIPFTTSFIMRRAGSAGDADLDRVVYTNVPHLVVHHSPDGFEFGYGGSGAADLALNACQLYLNITGYQGEKTKCYDGYCWMLAWMLHQEFKREFVASVNWNRGAVVPFTHIDQWFKATMTEEILSACAVEQIIE